MSNEAQWARAISRNLDETTPRRGRNYTPEGWHRLAYLGAIILALIIIALVAALGATRAAS